MQGSQGLAAKAKFFGPKALHMDSMMIELYELHARYPQSKYFLVRFTHALLFFRVSMPFCERASNALSHQLCWRIALDSIDSKLCFVQFYEVLNKKMPPLNEIEKALNYIRLHFHRTQGISRMLSSAKEYGRIPVDSI